VSSRDGLNYVRHEHIRLFGHHFRVVDVPLRCWKIAVLHQQTGRAFRVIYGEEDDLREFV